MSEIKQEGNGNQASLGHFSPNTNISSNIITWKKKAGWFFSGFILPIVVGLIVEAISQGTVSEVLKTLLKILYITSKST